MADDILREKDLISLDGSIQSLINQLEQLNKSYGNMTRSIKSAASELTAALKPTSGAAAEGRARIDDLAGASSRLQRAQQELAFALSDTGKQVAWLKAQTSDANKTTVEHHRQIEAMATSYNRIKKDLDESIGLYKSLTAAEREDAQMGGALINTIIDLKNQLLALNNQIKPTVQHLSDVEKAERKLAYLQSEEGQKLLELRKQISEVIRDRKQEKAEVDKATEAYERLINANYKNLGAAEAWNKKHRELINISKLETIIAKEAAGSYNQLAAQYELNKIKLNAMSKAERSTTEAGQKLEETTLRLYQRMIQLQEATGNHRLSVGNYAKAWNGLGMAVSQIIREAPAAAVSLNTFFLAISNNVPILIDEIERVRIANRALVEQGKPTINIGKAILASIFSFQTALVAVLTLFSMCGKEIISWAASLIKGRNATMSAEDQLKALNNELSKSNDNFGKHITTLSKLADEWANLSKDDKSVVQWLQDNESAFRELDISVRNATEAENIFVDNTTSLIGALKERAKAFAARKLASDKYEEALVKENEADLEEKKGFSYGDVTRMAFTLNAGQGTGGTAMNHVDPETQRQMAQEKFERRIQGIRDEAEAIKADADAYFELSAGYEASANALLKAANIEEYHKKVKSGGRGRTPKDLTDTIDKNDIIVRKKYESSITVLMQNEYAKRRKAIIDTTMTENAELARRISMNRRYVENVDGKYKALTDSQKKRLAIQNDLLATTMSNNIRKQQEDLAAISREEQINSLRVMRETIDWRLDMVADSIEKEKQLRLAQVDYEEKRAKEINSTIEKGARSEEEITAEYTKKRIKLISEFDIIIYNLKKKNIENQLELVKKGSREELNLTLQKLKMERALTIAANNAKPADKQQSTAQINATFDNKENLAKGSFQLSSTKGAISISEAEFNIRRHALSRRTKMELQMEQALIDEKIRLAEQGALKMTAAELQILKAQREKNQTELEKNTGVPGFINQVGKQGFGGAILDAFDFNEEQIKAMDQVVSLTLDNINSIMEADTKLAEVEVETANKRVEAAQKVLDAEIEARNNGYANNVAQAQKDLELEKRQQEKKTKLLEQAQRRQEAINSITQASSLVTASANLWSTFSGMGPVGPALAIAAIAAMWASFAVSKVKARQLSKAQSDKYGEGGLEILEGGSHLTGNDIDLGTKNSKGNNMRAEGGEAMAIINKRNTRKYRKQLPAIIDSLNKGTFENKYLRAFDAGETLQAKIMTNTTNIDLSKLEKSVDDIKKQNETRLYTLGDGTTLVIKGNVKRFIKN